MTAENPSIALEPTNMKKFFPVWLGQLVSVIGSGLTSFALGVWIFEQTHQATPFAITVLIGTLPRILLSPLAGALVDRWPRRLVMILADSLDAFSILLLAILYFTSGLQIWMIFLASFISAISGAFQEPAYMAAVTMLVPRGELARASGMIQAGQSIESIISPLIAGFLVVTIGLPGIFAINLGTFAIAVIILFFIRIPDPLHVTTETETKQSIWKEAAYGWKFLVERKGLLNLLLFFALVNFIMNFGGILTTPLVLSMGDASDLGMVQMVSGVGMLAGSLVISAWGGPKKNRIAVLIGAIGLSSIGLVLAGIQPSIFLIGAGYMVMLFFIPIGSATSQAIFQTKVPPDAQGRVFSIRSMISRSIMPIAYLLSGPIADYVFEPAMQANGALGQTFLGLWMGVGPGRGIGLIFVISGLLMFIVCWLAYLNPIIRHVEHDLPDWKAG
ncbi:MAG TPA: MFS transporter [Longilinea sp.]|nr:MFS transporter [Longilinea sp.]